MSIKPKQVVYRNPDHFVNLEDYKDEKIFCDITIKVDDKRIDAHKIILASTIPYFKAMFCNDMAENKQHEVTIHDIDSEVVEAVINYAYSGQITVDESNAVTIIHTASFFSLGNVIEALDSTLHQSIFTPNNILSIRHSALTSNCPEILKKSNIFIQQYFLEVAKTELFLDLPVEDVNDLLLNDQLNVSSEQQVLEALISWITHDIEGRVPHLPQLMSRIRLHLISPEFLVNFVLQEENTKMISNCRKEIDKALGYHLLRRIEDVDNKYIHLRSCDFSTGCIFSISVIEGQSKECSFKKYNPLTDYSEKLKPLPVYTTRLGTTMYKNNYYVIGGYSDEKRLDTVYTYNCHENIWKSTSPLRKSCSSPAIAVLNDYIYKIGGFDVTGRATSQVERYCPVTGMWKTIEPMKTQRGCMQAIPYQGSIYVICGLKGTRDPTLVVERYDPRENQWMAVKSALVPRFGYASTLLEDRIFVFGGANFNLSQPNVISPEWNYLRSASLYDIRMDTWTEIAPLNVGRFRAGCVSNLKKIWVIGGFLLNGTQPEPPTEIYDPVNDSWSHGIPFTACEGETHAEITPIFQ